MCLTILVYSSARCQPICRSDAQAVCARQTPYDNIISHMSIEKCQKRGKMVSKRCQKSPEHKAQAFGLGAFESVTAAAVALFFLLSSRERLEDQQAPATAVEINGVTDSFLRVTQQALSSFHRFRLAEGSRPTLACLGRAWTRLQRSPRHPSPVAACPPGPTGAAR